MCAYIVQGKTEIEAAPPIFDRKWRIRFYGIGFWIPHSISQLFHHIDNAAMARSKKVDRNCFSVNLVADSCEITSNAKSQAKAKTEKPGRRHPDYGIPPVIVSGLSSEEAQFLGGLSKVTRDSIYADFNQLHAHFNPVSGYSLLEKIVDSVRRILDGKDVLSVLDLPKKGSPNLEHHSRADFVKKVFECVMKTVVAKSETGHRFSKKVKTKNKPVNWKTFWQDGFLLYRRFVHTCSYRTGVPYLTAIQHCADLGLTIATTKNQVLSLINAWNKGVEDFEESVEEAGDVTTYEEWYQRYAKRETKDEEFTVDITEILNSFKRIIKMEAAKDKRERKQKKPNRTRRPRAKDPNNSGANKKAKTTKKPAGTSSTSKTPAANVLESQDTEEPGGDSDEITATSPVVELLPVFDINDTADPGDEWLVFEIPYLASDREGTGDPHLVSGVVFVPEGSTHIKLTLFIKVKPAFAYTFERADMSYHGQVYGCEKTEIEERCRKQGIPFMSVEPKDRLWSVAGVNVCDSSSSTYKKIFDGLRLDPRRIHRYLKKRSKPVDLERGTFQVTLGVSTQNYECTTKTPEEIERKLLDGPSWSGTKNDYEELAPLIRDLVDRMQQFIDELYQKPNKQCTSLLRFQLFAEELNKLLGCSLNRNETWTIAIAYIDPRTNVLLRHLDWNNDTRDGYTVTAVWSTVFDDILEQLGQEDMKVIVRLSLIGYTRKQAGNFHEKTSSYVTAFKSKIERLQKLDHYTNVARYFDLDLAELKAAGKFTTHLVWSSDSPTCNISCLVLPMFFDPCAFLSSFAWCIERMGKNWDLSRHHVVELVYLACIQSSSIPFVWLTEKLMEQTPEYCQDRVVELGISRFYHEEICKHSGRNNGYGGAVSRHQVCQSYQLGMVSREVQEFTDESQKKKDLDVETLDEIIRDVSDPLSSVTGKEALSRMRKEIPFLRHLNSLKVLPLAALVGLIDIEVCFGEALSGELPADKPHTWALTSLGCNTPHLQQKYIQGLNEYFGQPRDYFFHGDHVLCMVEGLHGSPNKRKWEPFFEGMPLMRFVEDVDRRVVQIVRKEFGKNSWVPHKPHVWKTKPE